MSGSFQINQLNQAFTLVEGVLCYGDVTPTSPKESRKNLGFCNILLSLEHNCRDEKPRHS
jgi:hypothetical protein